MKQKWINVFVVCSAAGMEMLAHAQTPLMNVAAVGRTAAPSAILETMHRSEWRTSTSTRSAQAEAAIDVDQQGNVTVTWSSRRQQDGRSSVYMQRFSQVGIAIGAETKLNLWNESHQSQPVIDSGGSNTMWAVWQSFGQDGDSGAIVARRFESGSDSINGGAEILINQEVAGHQGSPQIAVTPHGAVMFVWTSAAPESDSGNRQRIRARLFDSSGQPMTDEFGVSASADRFESAPAVTCGGDGTFVVAFAIADAQHRPAGIRAQRFNATGARLGDEIAISPQRQRTQIEPVIAATRSGFIVAWLDAEQDGTDYDVLAHRFDRVGGSLGEAFMVNERTTSLQNAAAIAVLPDDGLVIAYNSADEDDVGVFAQQFTAQGARRGGEFRINAHEAGKQSMQAVTSARRIACDRNGRLLCAWSGDGGLGDKTAVHATILSTTPLELNGQQQGVTEQMQPASSTLAIASASNDSNAPQPHIPPTFDPRRVEEGRREVIHGLVDIGFTGILSTGWNPPDPHLAVGPNHLVAMTNGAIAFFNKTGTNQFQDTIEGAAAFWGPLGATGFVFDPETLYDGLSGRFFAMASEAGVQNTRSFILIAVSDDSDPNGTWHKYRIETTALAGDTYDSPNMAVDANVLYITGDAGGFPVFTFDKASLLAGLPPAIQRSAVMPTSTQSAGMAPVSYDNPPALYMIEHGENASNTFVRLVALTNPLTTITFTFFNLPVPAYGPPEDPPQMGTGVRPESFDSRFWSVAYRNGFLWATHHVGGSRVLVRWYQIAMNGWPTSGQQPSLVQSGTIDPGPTVRTFFSAITVNSFNDAALVFARSSPTEFISMSTAVRFHTDPLGTFQAPVIRRTSDGPSDSRWGDYAGIGVDPSDPLTIWAEHEYLSGGAWRTWIASFQVGLPPPSNDLCANAVIASAGSTAFTTVNALTDGPDEPGGCNFNGFTNITNDIWYRYPAQCTGTATISLCGSSYNAKLAVYNNPCPGASGQTIACNDNFCGNSPQVSFPAVSGTLYRIRVGGVNGATGTGTMVITCTPTPPPCPADITHNSTVNVDDLLAVINAWGPCPVPPALCPADIAPAGAPNGVVNTDDLLMVINAWGPCP